MDKYYDNCEYVCFSWAIGFCVKEPVPTCRRFYPNYEDSHLMGTFERCCDVAISGRCLKPGAKEYEQHKIDMLIKEHSNEMEIRKRLIEQGYDTRKY